MADDYLSDREQEEALRAWWRENWRWIFGGIAVGLVVLIGYFQWQDYRARKGAEAANQFAAVRQAAEADDLDAARAALATIESAHGSSAYANQARLLVASLQVEAGNYDDAAALLRTVADKSKDPELAAVAKLRLARVLIQQGKHDEALALLNADKLGGFAAAAREIRGDAYVAKGDEAAARAEYAAALAETNAVIDRALVELKLQEAGGSTLNADATAQVQP